MKEEEEKKEIREILKSNFMFSSLDEKDQGIVVDAMGVRRYVEGELVIRQGDDGCELYIVAEGELKCYKRFPNNDQDTFLKNYQKGEVFGELALMYNTPRAASIEAETKSKLYSLDRDTFSKIVKTSAIKRR